MAAVERYAALPVAEDVGTAGRNGPNTDRRWFLAALYCTLYFLPSFGSFMLTIQDSTVRHLYSTTTEAISANVSYFLLANSLSTFIEPWLMSKLGMRRTLAIAASLNFFGCLLRSGYGWTEPYRTTWWSMEVAGTILLGLSQGIVQCPISQFACTWFPAEFQTEVTSFIMSFDNVGVGFSFFAPGMVWDNAEGLPKLLFLATVIAFLNWIAILLYFESEPPKAVVVRDPDAMVVPSEEAANATTEPSFWEFWKEGFGLLAEPGFFQLSAAFIFSATIQNSVSSYISITLEEDFDSDNLIICVAGFSFWTLNAAMALAVGPLVDRLKMTRPWFAFIGAIHFFSIVTLISIAGMITAIYLTPLYTNPLKPRFIFVLMCIIAGNFVSMVQPLANDAGLVCISNRHRKIPVPDENLVLSVLQLMANTLSSIFVDMLSYYESVMSPDYVFIYIGTLVVSIGLYMMFTTFKGSLDSAKSNRGGNYGTYIRSDGTMEPNLEEQETGRLLAPRITEEFR
eukprot:CAMPEP_0119484194 /NCGR_PEP_ID=MMETSP1344-20130328/11274_1 /TAXON_ID=236787 /ORGANISM="Florenciella parvula, Strain CCMP2471" /LENGTH=510 /DNA_ID=CAMNT_0007518739 /DNA_START=345 /DNA_END=1878 /DNA_ORIENTATION=-